jgi:hypothetical protein
MRARYVQYVHCAVTGMNCTSLFVQMMLVVLLWATTLVGVLADPESSSSDLILRYRGQSPPAETTSSGTEYKVFRISDRTQAQRTELSSSDLILRNRRQNLYS